MIKLPDPATDRGKIFFKLLKKRGRGIRGNTLSKLSKSGNSSTNISKLRQLFGADIQKSVEWKDDRNLYKYELVNFQDYLDRYPSQIIEIERDLK